MAGHPTSSDPGDTPGAARSSQPRTSRTQAPGAAAAPLPPVALRLLDQYGINAQRLSHVLFLLSDGRWWGPNDLVRASRVAHAVVSDLISHLLEAGELDFEDAQGRVRLVRPREYAGAHTPTLADPVAHLLPQHARAAAELTRAVAGGPESDLDLDHIAATADTAIRRALLLDTRFDFRERTLLCVGDHDLTALALSLVCPDARAKVVDIDERVLAHIEEVADALGLRVRAYSADLRLGLPSTLRGSADVVFTDPPYTPEGVELFVRCGLEGLADPRAGRLLLAYGASETTPKLIATTQSRLLRMDLAVEAMWPDFNRYNGAESIGAASDLYVLRSLSRTPPGPAKDIARVYSQGTNAREAGNGLDASRARAVLDQVTERDDPPATLVGDWPAEVAESGRVRLSTWMDSPTSVDTLAVVNLTGGWDRLAARAALASPTETVYVLVPSSAAHVRDEAGQRALRAMVTPRFRVRFLRGFGASDLTAVRFSSPEDSSAQHQDAPRGLSRRVLAEQLLAYVQERAHGVLTSTLRAGLVEVTARAGHPVNKRTARHTVATTPRWVAGHSMLDVPEHRFSELRAVIVDLVVRVSTPRPSDEG